ncbi:hypothetical protein Sbs19_42940 [Sphingobium sp. BS19]|nr:hypothetical protein Sbs19_42940 [Sphingobium sp. BS19]
MSYLNPVAMSAMHNQLSADNGAGTKVAKIAKIIVRFIVIFIRVTLMAM